ncbi:DUF2157 domain-containing protein [Comamonas sp.]|uniref:DUF2157 domain-containing protein n=1 Tax=Comamonas sp. TaxID=34028 RepID=UPI00289DC85D|nr:DUF2157 domain-containing protein [Comamonas sp.]
MDSTLYQVNAQSAPGDPRMAPLYALAVSAGAPADLARKIRTGLLLVAALLVASGLIFWVAANWQAQSHWFKLGLIEGTLALSVLAACLWPRLRLAALFCATLVLGGLLAYVGQTYQTGADAWQLFAAWAALALVWVALAASDLLWSVWVLIAAAAIVFWTGKLDLWQVLVADRDSFAQLMLRLALWLALALVPLLVYCVPALRVRGGMGWWSQRLALGGALAAWSAIATVQLFDDATRQTVAAFALSAVLVAGSLLVSLFSRFRDFICTCLATLAANVLVLSLIARWIFEWHETEALLAFAVIVMVCLGISVKALITAQHYLHAQQRDHQEVL